MIDQKVAIVTGGTRGIGAAISTALARSGVHVAAGYSRNQSAADDLASELSAEGASVSVHQGNVGVPEDCQRVVGEVLAATGRVASPLVHPARAAVAAHRGQRLPAGAVGGASGGGLRQQPSVKFGGELVDLARDVGVGLQL
jgi:NAD(P)-dependent dehydrogenase (short-subunit alcohol dehydrogenase family)